jgi:transposase
VAAGEERRAGVPVRIHVCFEAGRDGHWLHRALTVAGYEVYEIDPASVAVDRRARRVKSDGVDVDKLVRTLARLVRGERDACRVVVVPTPEEEDAKRPHREYERLVKERTSHGNRVKGLLFAQGVRDFDPTAPDRLKRLAELSIPPKLRAELIRECRRLAALTADIAEVEAEMAAAVVPSRKAKTNAAAARSRARSSSFSSSKASACISARCSAARSTIERSGIGAASGNISDWRRPPSRAATWRATRGSPKPATAGRAKRWSNWRGCGGGISPMSALSKWFRERVGDQKGRVRRIAIVAMARKLAVALWRYLETGLVPEGAVLKRA